MTPDHAAEAAPRPRTEPPWYGLTRRLVPRAVRNLARNPRATADWLRQEGGYRLGRAPSVPMADGWSVRCHPASAAAFRGQRGDEAQRVELEEFLARCTPGMVFFDVGASHGIFSLAAVRRGGPDAVAVAVDPSPVSNRLLRINLGLAGVAGRVRVVEAAVGREDGESRMLTTGPAGGHYLVGTDADRPDARRVPQYTLASLADRVGLVPTHLKVDVESFEEDVVRGGAGFLRRHRPLLFLELHSAMIRARGRRPEVVLALLADCGYGRVEWQGRPIDPAEAAAMDLVRLVLPPDPAAEGANP